VVAVSQQPFPPMFTFNCCHYYCELELQWLSIPSVVCVKTGCMCTVLECVNVIIIIYILCKDPSLCKPAMPFDRFCLRKIGVAPYTVSWLVARKGVFSLMVCL
jgi:hypothetical protein